MQYSTFLSISRYSVTRLLTACNYGKLCEIDQYLTLSIDINFSFSCTNWRLIENAYDIPVIKIKK
jgi:hypothetical protein